MPPRKKKTRIFLYLKVFIPIIVTIIVAAVGYAVYAVNAITKSNRALLSIKDFPKKLPDNWGQVVSFTWKEVQISGASGTLNGWVFIRGAGLPGIIITHGLGGSRADMMDLGYRLWERGYNVLIYDLRAHGESAALVTTLGASEKKDLAAAVDFFKTFKIASPKGGEVQLIDPNKIGLYGVNVGAYVSLMVGGENESVTAVVADMPYNSVRDFAHLRARELFGLDNFITNSLLDIGLQINQGGIYDTGSVRSQASNYQSQGKRVAVLIADNQSKPVRQAAVDVALALGPSVCEQIDIPKSRNIPLAGKDADLYNERVCSFFAQRGFPVIPLPNAASPSAAPAGTPPAAGKEANDKGASQ
ncbi:MAG: alpha/beta hydrolase [Acidobacteriota bacterium]